MSAQRMEQKQFGYKTYTIEPRSYEVLEGPRNPAGWVPHALLIAHLGMSVELQPLSLPSKIVATREEADRIALEMARHWIDEKG